MKGQSACGIAGTSKSVTLQYLPPTPTSITSSSGSYNACVGNSITYTVFVPAPSSSQRVASVYRWTKPNFTTILSAAADSSNITVVFNTGYSGGTLTVKGQTACGITGTAKSQSLTHTSCPIGTKINTNIPAPISLGDFDVKLSPNPTVNEFILAFVTSPDHTTPAVVNIRDAKGSRVQTLRLMPYENVRFGNELISGSYWIEVIQGERRKTLRGIKF